jgi:hypothetical protein
VGSDDGEEIVLLKKITAGCVTEKMAKCRPLIYAEVHRLRVRLPPVEIGASPDRIVGEVLGVLLVAEVLQRVGPQQVAHRAERGRLLEPVQLKIDGN